MKAYEACLNATSTHHAPWYVVPADDKENARLIVSHIILDALNGLKMAYPKIYRETSAGIEIYPQAAREVTGGCEASDLTSAAKLNSDPRVTYLGMGEGVQR